MQKTSKGVFEITRVVPSKRIKFFFAEENNLPVITKYEKIPEKNVFFQQKINDFSFSGLIEIMDPDGEVCDIKSPFYTKPRTVLSKAVPSADRLERIK